MRLPTKSTTFIGLMTLAAIAAFLVPPGWTNWLRGPFQIGGLVQWMGLSGVRGVSTTGPVVESIAPAEAEILARENTLLRSRLAEQQWELERLQAALDRATGIVGQNPAAGVFLVQVPVVGFDASPRHDSVRVLLGLLGDDVQNLVHPGQWVAAALYTAGESDRWERGTLIGRVKIVESKFATVQLASDPGFRAQVQVATEPAPGTELWPPEPAPENLVLTGQGGGRMAIEMAKADHFAAGRRLVMVPADRELPIPMLIGVLSGADRRRDSSVHYDLAVGQPVPVERLTHVFIIAWGE